MGTTSRYRCFDLSDPYPDQVAADAVPLGQTIKGLAVNELLADPPLELDRVDAVLGHGPYSSKARHHGQSENIICPPSGVHSKQGPNFIAAHPREMDLTVKGSIQEE